MRFLISDAMADTASAVGDQASHADGSMSLVMIVVIFVLFYFMLIRPQNKRAKEHRDLVGKIKPGDEIITTGGLLAKVIHVDEQYIKISPAENIEMTLQRGAISSVLPKGTLKAL